MADRLNGKVAIVFGAGCMEAGWTNGAATAVAYTANYAACAVAG